MSDLAARNTGIMIEEAKRMHAEVEELRRMIVAQNAKVTTLTNEVASVKQQVIMAAVAGRGNGGTT